MYIRCSESHKFDVLRKSGNTQCETYQTAVALPGDAKRNIWTFDTGGADRIVGKLLTCSATEAIR